MKTRMLQGALVLSLAMAGAASAQVIVEVREREFVQPDWESSVLTGRTVGDGRFAVHAEIGYPGAAVGFLWGQSPFFDLGLRLSAGYGTPLGFGTAPEAGAQAVLRWNFINSRHFSLGARLEPGVFVYPYDAGNVTLVAPFGLSFGIHPHPVVSVAIGADIGVGLMVDYRGRAALVLPLEVGPGLELNLTRHLSLTLDTRFGAGWSEPLPAYRGYGLKAMAGLVVRT